MAVTTALVAVSTVSSSSDRRRLSSSRPASVSRYTRRPATSSPAISPSSSRAARRGYTVPDEGRYIPMNRSSRATMTS